MPTRRALPTEVQRLRERMDGLNLLLVSVLQLRARLALAVGRAKAAHGLAAPDPARERSMLRRMLAEAPPGFDRDELAGLLRAVLAASRRLVVADRADGTRRRPAQPGRARRRR